MSTNDYVRFVTQSSLCRIWMLQKKIENKRKNNAVLKRAIYE